MDGNATILIVDDEPKLLKSLSRSVRSSGYRVLNAADGSSAYMLAIEAEPDLILLDADIPLIVGQKLCGILRRDRRTQKTPIIIMSGEHVSENDQLKGFEKGADEYILKPFSTKVLLARIHALLKRFLSTPETKKVKEFKGIDIDIEARIFRVDGKKVHLTRKEFDLLVTFLRNPGRVLRPLQLLESVWGYDPADYNDPHTVYVHISSLRRKVGSKLAGQFVNIVGCGYRYERLEA